MMNDGTEKTQVYYNTRQDMERVHNWVKWVWRAWFLVAVPHHFTRNQSIQ